jgi:alkanesulfonate monooxygenase SsuD/methylene tetrahydromethanopterin reductase-like flavin-dependent oxidoreductase (luciferase family)
VTVKLGLTLPSFVDDPEIPIAVARAAEDAGLDAVFLYDHLWRGDPPNRRPALECFALLGAVAAETSRIQLGTLVARATLRPAATLANCFRTAQRVSGGRLIAGIGAGDSQSRAENEAFGLDFGTMVDRVAALHDAVRAAAGGDFPVWVGGHATPVREVVTVADGWNGWGHSPEHFARDVALVREVAPDATLTWGGLVLTGDDEARAQEKAERRSLPAEVLVGGPARLAEGLRPYVDRGAEWVILGPLDSSDPANAAPLAAVRELLQG